MSSKKVIMTEKPSHDNCQTTVNKPKPDDETRNPAPSLCDMNTGLNVGMLQGLQNAGDLFRVIYENVSDWIYIHDLDGIFVETNFHYIKVLGYTLDQLAGASVRDLMPERNKAGFDDYLARIVENGSDNGTMIIVTASGDERVVEYKNVLIDHGDGRRLVHGLARDITERLAAEGDLRKSEQKFRSIIENIKEGYYEVDLAGNFTFVNPSVCSIMGYDESELLGKNNKDYMDPRKAKGLFAIYNKVFKTGRPIDGIEFEIKRKDGLVRQVRSSVSLIHAKDKKPVGYRGIVQDVTEQKALEEQLDAHQKLTQNAREVTIMGLAKLSEYRDNDAGSHLERIREFSKIIAQELSVHKKYNDYVTEKYVEDIYQSAILHDIGKVGIPDSVLLKPGKLTPEEFEIIKEHSRLGGDAIRDIEVKIDGESFLTLAKEIAYYHHERWNGNGYPKGLAGEAIPLSARIVALADVYDALTSKRVYKEAFTHAEAIKIIVAERGRQFDPDIVDIFMARNKEFVTIRKTLDDRDEALKISTDPPSFV
jgi:PAS domain S-box-containing protein